MAATASGECHASTRASMICMVITADEERIRGPASRIRRGTWLAIMSLHMDGRKPDIKVPLSGIFFQKKLMPSLVVQHFLLDIEYSSGSSFRA
jgi:hypothetical protein